MAGLEVDECFLDVFNYAGINGHLSNNASSDFEFENQIRNSCDSLMEKLRNKAEEVCTREKALENAQSLFKEHIKNINQRIVEYRKSLVDDYDRKCKVLDDKQLELDCLKKELEKQKNNMYKENRPCRNKSEKIQSVIELDVGGNRFTTSLNTLCKDPNSMIAIMFSGRHNLLQLDDGSYFIDRDGTNFQYILNYLRGGIVSPQDLPEDTFLLNALRREVDFYQIRGFIELIDECLDNTKEKVDYSQEEIMDMMSPVRENETNSSHDVIQSITKCKLTFTNKKLNGISFAHTTFFHDVSFRNTGLAGANFYGCEFGVGVQINFNYADLTDCDFRQCKGKENGAKVSFAHGGGLLSASSSETFLQMVQEGRISFKKAKLVNTLFDPKVSDFLNVVRK